MKLGFYLFLILMKLVFSAHLLFMIFLSYVMILIKNVVLGKYIVVFRTIVKATAMLTFTVKKSSSF